MDCGTFQNARWYHGTSKRSARKLSNEPFRDWCIPLKTPNLKHLSAQFSHRYLHRGAFGRGIYITSNWRVAATFGPVIFEVSLNNGTKIIDLAPTPNHAVLKSLKHEFGQEILEKPFWRVLPTNKNLTLEEAIELARYFNFKRTQNENCCRRFLIYDALLESSRKALVRFGVNGTGEGDSFDGIVIFAADKIRINRVALWLPYKIQRKANNFMDQPFFEYTDFSSISDAVAKFRSKTSESTTNWVNDANAALKLKRLVMSRRSQIRK